MLLALLLSTLPRSLIAAAADPGTVTVDLLSGSQRTLPRMGFGTELVWQKASDSALAAAAAAAGNRVLRYPGGCVHKLKLLWFIF